MDPTARSLRAAAAVAAFESVLLIVVVMLTEPGRDKPELVDTAVERVIPADGDLDLRQARIGIDLAVGYTAVLVIDGVEIPEDQLQRVEPLNQVFFTPGPGTEIGAL